MAERRMFAKTIIDSDAFLDMPLSTQALYFHLSMRADDDGFINNPKKIQRMIGCCDDDLKLLLAKNFIFAFDSGVVVIKHWKIHNYIQKDRYKATVYQEEKAQLNTKENKAYTLGIPDVYITDTQVSLGQVSIVKDSLGQDSVFPTIPGNETEKLTFGSFQNVFLTLEEHTLLKEQFPSNYNVLIEKLSKGLEQYGYKYKSHYQAILQWVENDKKKAQETAKPKATTSGNVFADLLNDME